MLIGLVCDRDLNKVMNRERTSGSRTISPESTIGLICLLSGAALAAVIAADRWMDFRLSLPEFYYRSRNLHLPMCLALFGLGVWFHRRAAAKSDGPLFQQVVMYSRPDCCLCDEALLMLDEFRDVLPEVSVVDISDDAELEARHGDSIPVIEIDGRVRFRGIVNRELLTRLIAAERTRPSARQRTSDSAP
jgi:glutaredoxin